MTSNQRVQYSEQRTRTGNVVLLCLKNIQICCHQTLQIVFQLNSRCFTLLTHHVVKVSRDGQQVVALQLDALDLALLTENILPDLVRCLLS